MNTLTIIGYLLICIGLGYAARWALIERQEAKWKRKARDIQSRLDFEHHKRDYVNALLNTNFTTKKGVEIYNKYTK